MGKRPLWRSGGGPANLTSVKDFLERHEAQAVLVRLCQGPYGPRMAAPITGWQVHDMQGKSFLQLYLKGLITLAETAFYDRHGGVILREGSTRNVPSFLRRNGWTQDGHVWYPAKSVCKNCPFRLPCALGRGI